MVPQPRIRIRFKFAALILAVTLAAIVVALAKYQHDRQVRFTIVGEIYIGLSEMVRILDVPAYQGIPTAARIGGFNRHGASGKVGGLTPDGLYCDFRAGGIWYQVDSSLQRRRADIARVQRAVEDFIDRNSDIRIQEAQVSIIHKGETGMEMTTLYRLLNGSWNPTQEKLP